MEQSDNQNLNNDLSFTLDDGTEVDVSKFPSLSNDELKGLEGKLTKEFNDLRDYLQVIMEEMEKYSAAYNLVLSVLRQRKAKI